MIQEQKVNDEHPKPADKALPIIRIGSVEIGGLQKVFMCGPCAVESWEQIDEIAAALSELGVQVLRGGAFKPRSSPYAFQGLGPRGLGLLARAARKYGLKVVSEIVDAADLPLFEETVDILQIGSRNMHNYALLRKVGRTNKPILLKRGFMSKIEEWLLASEYILLEGNPRIILCERGIRTFETLTRNTLDLSCVPLVKRMKGMAVIVDLSHALGRTDIMMPMARAALAAGCDGLMIEIHPNPIQALSDGQQSLTPRQLTKLLADLRPLTTALAHAAEEPQTEVAR
jgi:3-deoxy-7-phosphoheptulonate synthase